MADDTSQPLDQRVLVVDLDQTLCRTDTLHEALLRFVVRKPYAILSLVGRLREGKAAFKHHLADQQIVAPSELVMDAAVLDFIERARSQGLEVVLVSASDQRQVDAIAAHLGVFDAAIGTGHPAAAGHNLGGNPKQIFWWSVTGRGRLITSGIVPRTCQYGKWRILPIPLMDLKN